MTEWGGRRAQRLVELTLATYGTTCHLCLKPGATTADHIVPRVLGGDDSIDNLRPAHKLCNSQRGAHTIQWFRLRYAPHLVRSATRVNSVDFFRNDVTGHPAHACPFSPDQNKSGEPDPLETTPIGAEVDRLTA